MKKKMLNISLYYAIAAMVGGVFYREFTKWNGFTGVTALGKVHVHLFVLGMGMFLIAALFAERQNIAGSKKFNTFMRFYNIGLIMTAIMLVVRGVAQVLSIPLSTGMSAAISGIAGIGHIILAVGLIAFLLCLRETAEQNI